MALTYTRLQTPVDGRRCQIVKWTLTAGETGTPYVCAENKDKTVVFEGTFGGNMSLTGTCNPASGATMHTLHDPSGTALSSISANKITTVLEHVYQIAPVAGSGVSSVDVYLLVGDAA